MSRSTSAFEAATMIDVAAARGALVAVTVVRPDVPEGGRADSQPRPGRLADGVGGEAGEYRLDEDAAHLGVCGVFACDAPDRWGCGVSFVEESAGVVGGAGSGGGSVSRNDVLFTPSVHVDVVGLRPVLWAVGAALVPGCCFARSRCWLCRSRPVASRRGGGSPASDRGGTQSGRRAFRLGSWPGVGCEIVAGVRAAGVTRGWGRTNPEPGGPHPDPSPSRCRHPGAGKPKRGEKRWA